MEQVYTYPDPHVSKRGKLKLIQFYINANGCHICISHALMGANKNRYPEIFRLGTAMPIHRYVYLLEKGPIPKGMDIMHSCDNPQCFNILHLSVGTHQENMADMCKRNREAYGEKHGKAILTAKQAYEIFIDPRPHRVIAKEYGTNQSKVSRIKRGQLWVKGIASWVESLNKPTAT